jgi:3-isopropylmalate/(R)-2-methylmalate dehydratase large subunit
VDGGTYKTLEFAGDGVYSLSIERMTLCNIVIEAGGKNGVIAADESGRLVRSRTVNRLI